jgi:hypothetical protein
MYRFAEARYGDKRTVIVGLVSHDPVVDWLVLHTALYYLPTRPTKFDRSNDYENI